MKDWSWGGGYDMKFTENKCLWKEDLSKDMDYKKVKYNYDFSRIEP